MWTLLLILCYRAVGRSSFFQTVEGVCSIHCRGPANKEKENNERIRRTANLPEEEKMQVLGEQLDHLRTVEEERKH